MQLYPDSNIALHQNRKASQSFMRKAGYQITNCQCTGIVLINSLSL